VKDAEELIHAFKVHDGHVEHPYRISMFDEKVTCSHCREVKGLSAHAENPNVGKELSNPFSTGSGGARFEANIQATYVTLMLSGGYAPCLPPWPIVEIKLQGAVAGYATDDLIVFVENPATKERRRLLGQVKHSIQITKKNKIFSEVIQAAWNDFNNEDVFTKGKDLIALITGPLSATDRDGVTQLLEQARHTSGANEFFTQINRAKFSSDVVRNKLNAFKEQLKTANGGYDVNDNNLYEFLRHFHLLGYDLAKRAGVVSSLLQSHISQFNREIADKIWFQILSEVQSFNQYAGTITVETLSEDLVAHFEKPDVTYIPSGFAEEKETGDTSMVATPPATNWNNHPSASKLALAVLVGSWSESIEADLEVVSHLVGQDYGDWISDLREIIQFHDSPITYKNGVWSFKERMKSWEELSGRLFTDHISTFQSLAVRVLGVDDPALELPSEQRYAAAIYEKVLPHSNKLRQGVAEGLALVGSSQQSLTNIGPGEPEIIAAISIRQLFEDSDWVRWASLNDLLPTLSEAHPDEFLSAVENAISASPSPFEKLFEEEDTGIFGQNYISGLLWALEGIAWDEVHLSRVSVVLADLASEDPGGSWTNRPENSLIDIFLPWMPHTLASVEKRQAALRTISVEQPGVAWKLLQSLLPGHHRSTSGTHRPVWRKTIPDGWKEGVTRDEYWEQSRFCAELLVEQAGFNVTKLAALAANYDHLPTPASRQFADKLMSKGCLSLPEQDRLPIWSELRKLIAHHRRFPDAPWSLGNEPLSTLEIIADQLSPKTPSLLHRRLFSDPDAYLYEGEGDWEKEQEKLFEARKAAVEQILDKEGLDQVLLFARQVKNPDRVGEALADFSSHDVDSYLIPRFLDQADQKIWYFVSAYAWRRRYTGGWQWFDDLDKSGWQSTQISNLLCALPFERNAWERVVTLLGQDECEYWRKTSANTYQTDDETDYALEKLLEYDRPSAVIDGLSRDIFRKRKINPELACNALLALVKSEEESAKADGYHIQKIIKTLQECEATDPEKLFQVEWAYVPLLVQQGECSPLTLEMKLASEPSFFCELVQLIYRAEGAEKESEPSEQRRQMATNAYRLLSSWSVVPGTQHNGEFDPDAFSEYLNSVEAIASTSGHYDVALIQLGNVLVNSPSDPSGLWIHANIAAAMNARNRSSLRDGYRTGIKNARGVHTIDPEGKPEKALANKYREQADSVENAGYHRLAITLREVADSYDQEAARIISRGDSPPW
jgi:hypothetical protein